eukprot:jgi/Mesvir1/26389/Mv16082-RA.2
MASTWLVFTPFLVLLLAAGVHAGGFEGDYPYAVNWNTGACASGVRQSPIDIVTKDSKDGEGLIRRLQTDWQPDASGYLKVSDHNIQYDLSVDAASKSKMIHNSGEVFYLKQFHVHSPSEHSINGVLYPLEAHFVHLNEAGNKAAVIGINFHYSTTVDNTFLPPMIAMAMQLANQTSCNTSVAPCKQLFNQDPDFYHTDFGRIITEDSTYYHYEGSLTTPPCSEIVSWHVMHRTVPISPKQIQDLQQVLYLALGKTGASNNRPPMPLNFRNVWVHKGADYPSAPAPAPCNTNDTPDIIIGGGNADGASDNGEPSSVAVAGLAIACIAIVLSLLAVALVLFCIISQAKQMLNMALSDRDKAFKSHPIA